MKDTCNTFAFLVPDTRRRVSAVPRQICYSDFGGRERLSDNVVYRMSSSTRESDIRSDLVKGPSSEAVMTASNASGCDRTGPQEVRRDPLLGTLLNGKYRVERSIARGGMGRVYYAVQVPINRPVALKVVQADGDREHASQFLKRFLQEASILAKLQHANVVMLFDYGRVEGTAVEQYFMAMEFLAGETLMHRLRARKRLRANETVVLARQIVQGLGEAHKRGVVHRDLKPSNIILVPEGDGTENVKLVDFGIGKVLDRNENEEAQDITMDGSFVGTPRYMAPEQFEGSASPASDLYALGTILFQALAGRLPFPGSTMAEFMVAKLQNETPRVKDVAPDTDASANLQTLIFQLLARNPLDRLSMEDLNYGLFACEEELFVSQSLHGSGSYSQQQTGANAWRHSGRPLSLKSLLVPSAGSVHGAPLVPVATAIAETSKPTVRSWRLGAGVALATVLLTAGTYGVVSVRERSDASPAPVSVTATGNRESSTFMLTLFSVPSGATVEDGERILGETPLSISIARGSVAQNPRTFVVRKGGFSPARLVQGPATDSQRVTLTLEPLAPVGLSAVPSPSATSATGLVGTKAIQAPQAPQAPSPPKFVARQAAGSSSESGSGLDIRMKR